MRNITNGGMPKGMMKAITAGCIGNVVEWIDFALYGFVAPFIAAQFFPSGKPTIALLQTWGVFAVGYLSRPIGGLILGPYGDKHGRNKALALTIILMGGATGAIGLIPGHATIGIFAPLLLISMRLIQGLAMGGEWGAAVAFIYEVSPPNRRAFVMSFRALGVTLGYSIGGSFITLAAMFLSPEAMRSWGWRLGFPVAFLTALFGLYIRRRVTESPDFIKAKERKETTDTPLIDSVKYNKKAIMACIGMEVMLNSAWVVIYILLPTTLTTLGVAYAFAVRVATGTMWLASIVVLFCGWLADKYSRKMLLAIVSIAYIVLAYPGFRVISTGNHWIIWGVFCGFSMIMGLLMGVVYVVMTEQFPVKTRNTSLSLANSINIAITVGFGPLIVTFLTSVLHNDKPLASACYMIAGSVIGLIGVNCAKYPRVEAQSRELDVAREADKVRVGIEAEATKRE
jgi:MHS family proline/betaine transporter-like MFS transporter